MEKYKKTNYAVATIFTSVVGLISWGIAYICNEKEIDIAEEAIVLAKGKYQRIGE